MSEKNQDIDQAQATAAAESAVEEAIEEAVEQERMIEAETEAVEETLENVADQVKTLKDRLLRAHAEMENIRRRGERDIANAHKFGVEKMVKDLLPVIDSLEKAQDHAFDNEEAKAIHEGVTLTMKMFLDALAKFGVECIDPIDDPFNPELHEAMSMVEQDGVVSNMVINVLQKGYRLNGRLIRPARVFVSK